MNLLKYYLIVLPLLASLSVLGQEVVWADQLIEFSSELDNSAVQVLGAPDAIEQQNQDLAWTPKKEGLARGEFMHVKFAFPIRTRQIIISEATNPGAIFRLTAFFTDGSETLIYENKYPRNLLVPNRVFTYQFPLTRKKVVSLKLEMDTRSVKGYNRIDAIGISGETERYTSEPLELQEKEGNLGTEVNSAAAEVSPKISADGNTLYFVRHNHSDNMGEGDIWVSKRLGEDRWSTAVNLGAPINNRQENQVIGVGRNGTQLYLKMGREKTDNNNIFTTKKSGRSWGRPKRLNTSLPTDLSLRHIYVSGNGKTILVAIETPKSGFDLQITYQRLDGTWSELTSLGKMINTSEDETSACLSADGKTLYFSSNGHGGMGGQDFFVSQRKGDSWSDWTKPINLGNEINDATNNEKMSLAEDNVFQPTNDLAALSEGSMITKKGTDSNLRLRLQKIDQRITDLEKTKEELRKQKLQSRAMPNSFSEGEEIEKLRGKFIENKKNSTIISREEYEEDAELAKMKNKFNQVNGRTTSTTAKGRKMTKDRELEEMKKRFNKYNGKAESTNDDQEYMDMEVSNGQVYDEEYDQVMYSGGFTDLQQKMWTTLETELADLVKLTIKKQIYTKIETNLLQSLSANLDEAEQYRFKQQGILLYREIKKELIEDISFRKNSGILKSQSSSAINQMVDFLEAHENLSVEIGIFDDGTGKKMAFIRAKTIYESLMQRGITANRLLYRDYPAERKTSKSSFVKTQLKIVTIR